MLSTISPFTRVVVLLFVVIISSGLPPESRACGDKECAICSDVVPTAVAIPSTPVGTEEVKCWLHRLLKKAKDATNLDPMPIQPFKVMVASTGTLRVTI